MTLGDYPDPDLEVSERFKRSLARVDLLDIPEISWLGAVARVQARTSIALVRREQHKHFQEWVLSASNPRAPRGAGIGKLHRQVNSPNAARSLCQVSTEEGVLRSTPSFLMEVREAVLEKRWQRDAPDSVSLVVELVAVRAQAIAGDVPLLEPVTVDKLDQTLRRIPDNTGEIDQSACFPKSFELWIGCFTVNFLPGVILLMVFGDRAIANCSALRSAIHTSLMMETAHIVGISAGILFIDLQKIYSVDLVLLIKCSVLEYPRIPLLLRIQAFFGTSHFESRRTSQRTGTCFQRVGGRVLTGRSLGQSLASSCPTRPSPPMSQVGCFAVCGRSQDVHGRNHKTGCVQVQPTSRRPVPHSWEAQSRSVALKMWVRGHHTWHSPYCVFRLAGKGFRYFLNQTCKRLGCGCLFW